MLRRAIFCLSCLGLLTASASPTAHSRKAATSPDIVVTEELGPPSFLPAKIALDRIVDPSIQPAEVEGEIGKLIAAARIFAGPHPSVGTQFDAVRKVLYQPGPWNDNRPFAYDNSEPLGEKSGTIYFPII